uniref:Lysosome-associated membrane glycoprotein 1 n=1 Tax=Ailuropoda melanoleuca TaxID=9646 RepID=A0A7N5JTW3_AILME
MAVRCGVGLLLAAVLLGFIQTSSTLTFQVSDRSGKLCLSANFIMEFTVEYSTKTKKENTTFELPPDADVIKNASVCDNTTSKEILEVGFGKGHSLKMVFERNASLYMLSTLVLKFNLSDSSRFPNSSGELKEETRRSGIQADLNTRYLCKSSRSITMQNMSILISNVVIEAYIVNGTISMNETTCSEDKRFSTVAPIPTTGTPSTTSLAPPVPSKNPEVGQYSVNSSSGLCLLASMALQLNITYSTKNKTLKSEVLNLPPNATFSGKCENLTVTLNLVTGSTNISFHFGQNVSTEVYFLQSILVNASLPSEATEKHVNAFNDSLSALKGTLGKSYKCVAEESILVSDRASLNVFNVQIQAFKITGDKFGAVEECQLDENSMLIPIVVGAALAGLVLIVLIAYLIGRKRSHAGYQTI